MRTSIWFRTEERQPDKSGYYLAYRGWGMGGKGDGDHDHGYVYYDKKKNEWRDYQSTGHYAIVYYWTNATPDEWVEQDPPSIRIRAKYNPAPPADEHLAVQDAWKDVEEAIKRYETVKALCETNS
jgi:hypothetical protein